MDPNTSYCNRMSASQLCSAQAEHAGKVSKPIAPRNFCENKGLHTVQCRAGVDIRHHELAENYGFRELQGGRSTIDTTAGSMSAECADGDAGAAAILPAMVCQEGHISLLCESSSGLASHACPRDGRPCLCFVLFPTADRIRVCLAIMSPSYPEVRKS